MALASAVFVLHLLLKMWKELVGLQRDSPGGWRGGLCYQHKGTSTLESQSKQPSYTSISSDSTEGKANIQQC